MDVNAAYSFIARMMISFKAEKTYKYKYEAMYYKDGDAEFPFERYDMHGERLKDIEEGEEKFEVMDAISGITEKINGELKVIRESLNEFNGRQPNHFTMVINHDRTYSVSFEYDSDLDARLELRLRASIGDDEYERFERERKEKAEAMALGDSLASPEKQAPESATVDDVLDYLYKQASEAAPEGWGRIKIEFGPDEPRSDGKKSIAVSHYVKLTENGGYQLFDTLEPLGVINAIEHMRRCMAEEGRKFDSITYHITPENINFDLNA